jgi:hypothetical protein
MHQPLLPLPSFQIPSLIEKASLFGGSVTQPSAVSGRTASITNIAVNRETLYIKLGCDVLIERKLPVEIHLSYRNLSFYLGPQQFSLDGDLLISKVPREARAIAIRDNERYAFPLTTKVSADLRRVEKRGVSFAGEVQLVDVSRKGLGILLVNAEVDGLLKNDHIWLREIGLMSLGEDEIFGNVIYSFEKRFKDSIDLKCGISLETELPEDVFGALQRQCCLVLKA